MRIQIYSPFLVLILTVGILIAGCGNSETNTDDKAQSSESSQEDIVQKLTLVSPIYTIDKKYKSMKGPYSVKTFTLGDDEEQEIVWVKSMTAEVLSEDGQKVLSDEFMCHANLDFVSREQKKLFGNEARGPYNRLFTLSQGQTQIKFPEGFGIPMLSDTKIELTTQVLNHNEVENLPIKVRQKVTIEYVRDKDLKEPLTPLYRQDGAYILVSMSDQPAIFNVENPLDVHSGASCMPGENAGTDVYRDKFGRMFSGHWAVKPGKEENHTVITENMSVPYDTEIHAIGVHLHPFAESLSLKDLTTGEIIYTSEPTQKTGAVGLANVPYYSNQEGIPLYKDHEYSMISVYDNTTADEHDAMAVFGIYAIDHDFNPTAELNQ